MAKTESSKKGKGEKEQIYTTAQVRVVLGPADSTGESVSIARGNLWPGLRFGVSSSKGFISDHEISLCSRGSVFRDSGQDS